MERTVRIHLVEERKSRGWSQQELADALGTTQHNVSRWEAGHTTPSPYFRTKLCELFGMSIQELLLQERNTLSSSGHTGVVVTQLSSGFKHHARQAALTGNWDGTVHDEERAHDFYLTLQFQSARRRLQGEGHLRGRHQSKDLTQSVMIWGKCVSGRFLKLEYTLGEPLGAIQFGLILLEFMPDGQALYGGFVGYGALVTQGIVTGTVHLQKREAYEMYTQ